MRPAQVLKSGLVVFWGLFVAAGGHLPPLRRATTAIGVMLFWSGLYILNDLSDIRIDARSETKQYRPLASHEVTPSAALSLACGLLVGAICIGGLSDGHLLGLLAAMLANHLAYCF